MFELLIKGFDGGIGGDLGIHTHVCAFVCAPLVTLTLRSQASSCCFFGFEVTSHTVVWGQPQYWVAETMSIILQADSLGHVATAPVATSYSLQAVPSPALHAHTGPTCKMANAYRGLSEMFKYLQLLGSEFAFQGVWGT